MPPLKRRTPEGPWWQRLSALAESPALRRWIEHGIAPADLSAPSRRGFLGALGASAALAGLASCRWPEERILPYADPPEGLVPGVTRSFATAQEVRGVSRGLLVTSYDGRPIKVEGNPLHPGSLGGTDAWNQAAILDLYDPRRLRRPRLAGQDSTWEAFDAWLAERLAVHASDAGRGLAVILPATASPTALRLLDRLRERLPEVRIVGWEPAGFEAEERGTEAALGTPGRALLDLLAAEVLVSLDADLLGTHPDAVRLARLAGAARDPDRERPLRIFCVESAFTLTGASADRRWAVPPQAVQGLAAALALALFDEHHLPVPAGAEEAVAALRTWPRPPALPDGFEALAARLAAAGQAGVLAVGHEQPAVLHALAWLVNAALGSRAVRGAAVPGLPSSRAALAGLVGGRHDGAVGTLLILDGDPVGCAPADLDLAAWVAGVEHSARLGLAADRSTRACRWQVPLAHFLEAWGDGRGWDGTPSIVQPLIAPLHGGRSVIELLGALAGEAGSAYGLVRATFGLGGDLDPRVRADRERLWAQALRDGVSPLGGIAPALGRADALAGAAAGAAAPDAWAQAPLVLAGRSLAARLSSPPQVLHDVLALRFQLCPKVLDGRFAHNPWLQELPDPLTKLTWDNAALLAPATAASLGIATGDVVYLHRSGAPIEIAALVLPGQPEDTVGVALGYGGAADGEDPVGVDVAPLRRSDESGYALGPAFGATGARRLLSATQDHFPIDDRAQAEAERRAPLLVREASPEVYREHPDFAAHAVHHPPLVSAWTERQRQGPAWGMVVDLNRCTGCGTCTVACQAENNIPVVGRDQVANGREMHWIRVDRYFTGDPGAPRVAFQPMTCQHCELAPCEQVCPVAATQHSADGLNTMVYNRCVGTRYCANNCPFKVRRFNFFPWSAKADPLLQLARNPEVTVRSRGVMEKCSYCVQRIAAARLRARNEGRPIRDGEVVPACAQACPAGAIAFGDLADPASRIAALAGHPRAYALLPELNLKPRTRYLARVREGDAPGGAAGGEEGHGA